MKFLTPDLPPLIPLIPPCEYIGDEEKEEEKKNINTMVQFYLKVDAKKKERDDFLLALRGGGSRHSVAA